MSANGPVVGIVLAAGRGERFDPLGRSNKLLARIADRTVLDRALASLADCCDRLIAVVRDEAAAERVRAMITVSGVEIVPCADAHEGMGRSLACGARAALVPGQLPEGVAQGAAMPPRAVLVLPGDMPFLRPETAAAVLAALTDAQAIVAPAFRGQRGHPVAFGADHLRELTQLEGDQGARALLHTHPVVLVPTDDAGTVRDIDTPEDLRTAEGSAPTGSNPKPEPRPNR